MKIFLLITKAEVGGAQMSVLNLARGLKEKGEEVKVGFGEGEFLPEELKKAGIPYTRFKNLKRTHNPLANLFFIGEIKRYFDKNKYEVVHINSSNALFAALGAKLSKNKPKTVFTVHGMSMLDENYKKAPVLKAIYKIFFKFFFKFVDEPVFVSKHNLGLGKQLGLAKKENLVYNGLAQTELNFYTREEARKKILPPLYKGRTEEGLKDFFLIGSIGRLAYQKNYEFLIEVFPEILKIKPNSLAIIIGDGPEKESLQNLIKEKELEDKIILAGSIAGASKYLKAFDLFVLPSRYEGLSITLIETLFAGVSVLASDVGGNRETLPSDQEIYGLEDKKDFLDKFQTLSPENTREQISKQNLEHSNKFLLEKTLEGYQQIYNR